MRTHQLIFRPFPSILLLALVASSWSLVHCADPEVAGSFANAELPAVTGSVRMQLQVGNVSVTRVTAVISGRDGFETQTHTIDVSGDEGVISIFFGSLPAGRGYSIALMAGPCTGSASFQVSANEVTIVPVLLDCGAVDGEAPKETGGVEITGVLNRGAAAACDPITKIVAAPSIQDGDGPIPRIELVLAGGLEPSSISWSASSPNGGTGELGALDGALDREVTFECNTNGSVSVTAIVAGTGSGGPCTEEARVSIQCLNQGDAPPPPPPAASCGDGTINQASEQCDGSVLPAGAQPGSTCSAVCAVVPPAVVDPTPSPSACALCARESCGDQRTAVDANVAAIDPILDCVLGSDWPQANRVAAGRCANADLLTCYCGTATGPNCANAAPASLDGPCVSQVLAGTACSTSSCVAPVFLNPVNVNGKAMQYAQCLQDFCYEPCFSP